MTAKTYWVVGGTYTDTTFSRIAGGGEETWFGPFPSYDAAKAEWQRLAWQTVDDCHARYRIEEREVEGSRLRYWVVGGTYADTHFREIAGGGEETRFGPFDTYAEAQSLWRRLAWASVDDCHVRYRIEHTETPPGQ